MTDYPYEPPSASSATPCWRSGDFELASTWGVRVENDPLGPVNKIVRLMRGQRREIASVLWPVPDDATVRLVRDDGITRWALMDSGNSCGIAAAPISCHRRWTCDRLAGAWRSTAPRSCPSPIARSLAPAPCAARSRGAREPSGDCAGGSTPPSIAPSCRWGTTTGMTAGTTDELRPSFRYPSVHARWRTGRPRVRRRVSAQKGTQGENPRLGWDEPPDDDTLDEFVATDVKWSTSRRSTTAAGTRPSNSTMGSSGS